MSCACCHGLMSSHVNCPAMPRKLYLYIHPLTLALTIFPPSLPQWFLKSREKCAHVFLNQCFLLLKHITSSTFQLAVFMGFDTLLATCDWASDIAILEHQRVKYCKFGVVKLNIGMRWCLESPSHSYPTLAWLFLAHWAFRRANLYNVTADPEPKLSLLYCFAVLTLVSFPGKALGQHKSGSKSETWSTAQWAQGYPVKHEHMSSVPSTPAKSLAWCCESVILALGR